VYHLLGLVPVQRFLERKLIRFVYVMLRRRCGVAYPLYALKSRETFFRHPSEISLVRVYFQATESRHFSLIL